MIFLVALPKSSDIFMPFYANNHDSFSWIVPDKMTTILKRSKHLTNINWKGKGTYVGVLFKEIKIVLR